MNKAWKLVLGVCVLAALLLAVASCGGGGGQAVTPSDWDTMLWDAGRWQ